MKCIKTLALCCVLLGCSVAFASEKPRIDVTKMQDPLVEIDFKDLTIMDLIKFVSKVTNKNILVNYNIPGKIDFISNRGIRQSELLSLLTEILDTKGYTLAGMGDTLSIVRTSEATRANLPIYYDPQKPLGSMDYNTSSMMVTEFIDLKNENVDVVSSKIRHLSSRYGKIITNTNTNTLIIHDFPGVIATLKQAIKIVSRDNDKTIRSIEVKNMPLNTMIGHVRQVINAFYKTTIVPARVTVLDSRDTNSLILIGQKGQVQELLDYIVDLDKKAIDNTPVTDEVVKVIRLKNIEVKNILPSLQALINVKKAKDPQKPVISSDNENNALIIIGKKEDMPMLLDMIETLDKEKKQVYVSVKIIEISKTITDKIGAKYGLTGSLLTSNGFLSFATNLGGSAPSVPAGLNLADNLKQTIMIGAGVDFLVDNSVAKVVSEPSVISLDNKESSIVVGENRSILTGTSTTNGTTTTSYARQDIGLELKVKPRVSNDAKVSLNITAKLEDIVAGSGNSQTPTTTKRQIQTTAIVQHGESVIVGGLVKRKKTNAESGLNFLAEVPLLGPLFGGHTDGVDNVNLVIIMTPYIIETSSSLSDLRKELAELEVIRQEYLKQVTKRLETFKKGIDLEDLSK